jgi:hypothetical protein
VRPAPRARSPSRAVPAIPAGTRARIPGSIGPPRRRRRDATERRSCAVPTPISEAHRAQCWARRDSCASSRSPAAAPGQQRAAATSPNRSARSARTTSLWSGGACQSPRANPIERLSATATACTDSSTPKGAKTAQDDRFEIARQASNARASKAASHGRNVEEPHEASNAASIAPAAP